MDTATPIKSTATGNVDTSVDTDSVQKRRQAFARVTEEAEKDRKVLQDMWRGRVRPNQVERSLTAQQILQGVRAEQGIEGVGLGLGPRDHDYVGRMRIVPEDISLRPVPARARKPGAPDSPPDHSQADDSREYSAWPSARRRSSNVGVSGERGHTHAHQAKENPNLRLSRRRTLEGEGADDYDALGDFARGGRGDGVGGGSRGDEEWLRFNQTQAFDGADENQLDAAVDHSAGQFQRTYTGLEPYYAEQNYNTSGFNQTTDDGVVTDDAFVGGALNDGAVNDSELVGRDAVLETNSAHHSRVVEGILEEQRNVDMRPVATLLDSSQGTEETLGQPNSTIATNNPTDPSNKQLDLESHSESQTLQTTSNITPPTPASGVHSSTAISNSHSTVTVSNPHPITSVEHSHSQTTVSNPHPTITVSNAHTSTSVSNPHPTTSVSNPHPTTTVSNPHPTTTVSNPHPTTTVSNPHPTTSVSNPHPTTTVSNPHPIPTVSNAHPATSVSNPHPTTTVSNSHPTIEVTTPTRSATSTVTPPTLHSLEPQPTSENTAVNSSKQSQHPLPQISSDPRTPLTFHAVDLPVWDEILRRIFYLTNSGRAVACASGVCVVWWKVASSRPLWESLCVRQFPSATESLAINNGVEFQDTPAALQYDENDTPLARRHRPVPGSKTIWSIPSPRPGKWVAQYGGAAMDWKGAFAAVEWAELMSRRPPTHFRSFVATSSSEDGGGVVEPQKRKDAISNEVASVCANGLTVVTGSFDGVIRVWSVAARPRCVRVLKGHQACVMCLCLSGTVVASGSWDHTVRVWSIARGRCELVLKGHRGGVSSVLIRGNTLVSASVDRTIRIWDTQNTHETQVLSGHEGPIWNMCWINHRVIATASKDATVRVWDIVEATCLAVLPNHGSSVVSVVAWKDFLMSGTKAGELFVWENTAPFTFPQPNTTNASSGIQPALVVPHFRHRTHSNSSTHSHESDNSTNDKDSAGVVSNHPIHTDRYSLLRRWRAHSEPILHLSVVGHVIFCASLDGVVRIFPFSVPAAPNPGAEGSLTVGTQIRVRREVEKNSPAQQSSKAIKRVEAWSVVKVAVSGNLLFAACGEGRVLVYEWNGSSS